jgi:hypothetical protein
MKIRPIHLGLAIAAALTFTLWISGQHRQAAATRALMEPAAPIASTAADPNAALASTPEARTYRSRQVFEQEMRAFMREAKNLDEDKRIARARAMNREIDQREKNLELSAGEAMMLRVGLIQAAIENESERVKQVQAIVRRYREQSAARQRAFLAQQQRDEQFQTYKAREAQIVSEVLAMTSYPGGMSRDDYLRIRLQEARQVIYGAQRPPPTP